MQITIAKEEVPLNSSTTCEASAGSPSFASRDWLKEELKAPQGFEIIPYEVELLKRCESPLPLDVTGKVRAILIRAWMRGS